jgi:hypothetical protein
MDLQFETQSEMHNIETQILYIKTQLTIEQNTIVETKNRCNVLEIRLKELEKKLLDKDFENRLKGLIQIEPSTEFNEWWQLWLKLYDKIYKNNETNKYYYISDNCIKEISIINNFPSTLNTALNINNIYFHDIITLNCQKNYLYKYVENDRSDKYYIYLNNKWLLQIEITDLINQLNNEWLIIELTELNSLCQSKHKIYKDEVTNKYYFSHNITNSILNELHIINSFPHNISYLYFVKQIEHKKQLYNLCLYKTDESNAEYYIYQNNKWTVFNYNENSK